ncbi:MAG: 3-hydroxyacyl-CoA dehydrogenase/enoyl-CoA hydratase family protein [Gammaproteobacteria bacterium]|nr:3-hydroxyacyl-CoA dehydrogenase/enoyl-CoA hydratase family protein [Gammaproteobacteria bacterium]
MQEPFFIKKVAVLGAGVMGAQIAAHVANAGIETCLFDLASEGKDPYKLVKTSIQKLNKLKPSPLGTKETAHLLKACQYDTDLAELANCDLVIEAIGERLDWKEALYAQITPHIGPKTIIVSNTSGLSINALADVLPPELQSRFCGVHFFNPPRYMHLAELIPAKKTTPVLLNQLETWLTSRLGKGVVRAKDTPNFIANRIGVFSLLATLYHAERLSLGLEVVDALTGGLLGRPKSATFRTMDVVGLDTLSHVVHTMDEQLKEDPWHAFFTLPAWLKQRIEAGHLGQKTGQGIYRKRGKSLEVYDIGLDDYRPVQGGVSDEIKAVFKLKNPSEQMAALRALDSPEAELIRSCFRDLFHYTAFHLESIASDVRDVDAALKWGFGWQQGPFETWQAFGVDEMCAWIKEGISDNLSMAQAPLPEWVLTKAFTFYRDHKAYSPETSEYQGLSDLAVYKRQLSPAKKVNKADVLFENEGLCLSHFKDDVAVLSFKTKSNTIGQSVLDGLFQAIEVAEARCQGMIVYQHNPMNFSSGADLSAVSHFIETNQMAALAAMVHDFQNVLMRLKYSTVPVISAVRGRALGGGCELLMQSDAVVAAFESYPGLVEAGVGLIPAGGGSKEFALRAAKLTVGKDIMPRLYPYFEQAAMGVVASSAADALERGFLRAEDTCMMHAGEVLFAALHRVKAMQAANYAPPIPERFKVAGREGCAQLKAALVNFEEGHFISEHDAFLASQMAYVMCGGDVDSGTEVDEAWVLRLEHEAFMCLAETPLTQARIRHMLDTGKPLRN